MMLRPKKKEKVVLSWASSVTEMLAEENFARQEIESLNNASDRINRIQTTGCQQDAVKKVLLVMATVKTIFCPLANGYI